MLDTTNYQPNSHKSKEEKKEVSTEVKKVEKVVTGPVRVKKKGEVRKLADVFISEDVHNVKNYILMDVLVPAIKDAIEDIITNGVRMILRGETSARKSNSNATKISYRSFYDKRDSERRPGDTSFSASRYSYDDIVFNSRGEAEEVRERMDELIDAYGKVTVADLYDLVGHTGNYTDNKYGWINIRSAEVCRGRDGYKLKLPRPMPLDD